MDDELARIGPAEVIYREDDVRVSPDTTATWSWTPRPAWSFAEDAARETLCKQFSVGHLDGFGFDEGDSLGHSSRRRRPDLFAGNPARGLDHFRGLSAHHLSNLLQIDAATRRSLEITRTIRSGSREGSLLGVIDRTCTPMGSRLLADWIAAPLIDQRRDQRPLGCGRGAFVLTAVFAAMCGRR